MDISVVDQYCAACGVGLSSGDAFCPKCGVQVGVSPVAMVRIQKPKDKTAAVLLAVFFGFWSWLYTFKASKAKFIFGLAISLVGLLIAVLEQVSWAENDAQCTLQIHNLVFYGVDNTTCDARYRHEYFGIAIIFAVWLWSLLSNVLRPKDFYENYGSRQSKSRGPMPSLEL